MKTSQNSRLGTAFALMTILVLADVACGQSLQSAHTKKQIGALDEALKEFKDVAANADKNTQEGLDSFFAAKQEIVNILEQRGEGGEAKRHVGELREVLQNSPLISPEKKLWNLLTQARYFYSKGDLQESRRIAESLMTTTDLEALDAATVRSFREIVGLILAQAGDGVRGIELLRKYFESIEKEEPNNHALLAYGAHITAQANIASSKFDDALKYLLISRKHFQTFGMDSEKMWENTVELARVHFYRNDLAAAHKLLNELLDNEKRGSVYLRASALYLRGELNMARYNYADAIVDFEDSLRLMASSFGAGDRVLAYNARSRLFDAALAMHSIAKAWELLHSIKQEGQLLYGQNPVIEVGNLLREAKLYSAINDRQMVLEHTSKIREHLKLAPNHDTEMIVVDLEVTQLFKGKEYQKAADILRAEIGKAEKRRGNENASNAEVGFIEKLINIELKRKDNDGARKLLDVLKNCPDDDPNRAYRLFSAANLEVMMLLGFAGKEPDKKYVQTMRASLENAKRYASELGWKSPDMFLYSELNLLILEGRTGEAKELSNHAVELSLEQLKDVLKHGSRYQKSNLMEGQVSQPHDLPALAGNAEGVLRACYYYKGALMDSLFRDDARRLEASITNPELADNLAHLEERLSATRLEQTASMSVEQKKKHGDRIKEIFEEIEVIERMLGLEDSNARAKVPDFSMNQLRACLPARSVLVEYVEYSSREEMRYGAVILPKEGDAKWVDLGSKVSIDDATSSALEAWRSGAYSNLKDANGKCSKLLWHPIDCQIGVDVETLVISPCPTLSEVPFAFLVSESGDYICKHRDLAMARTTRDLLRIVPKRTAARERAVLVEGGEFGGTGRGRDLFPPLPGIAAELECAGKRLNARAIAVERLSPSQATEAHVKRMAGYDIIHFATHGFFVSGAEKPVTSSKEDLRGPGGLVPFSESKASVPPQPELPTELSSRVSQGLALKGAGESVDLRTAGSAVDAREDGLLTVSEIAACNWKGTWLLFLSACSSGRGGTRLQGSESMPFAVTLSGVENAVYCLWPVGDISISQIADHFYQELLEGRGKSPVQALAATQRRWLVDGTDHEGELRRIRQAAAVTCWVTGDRWDNSLKADD